MVYLIKEAQLCTHLVTFLSSWALQGTRIVQRNYTVSTEELMAQHWYLISLWVSHVWKEEGFTFQHQNRTRTAGIRTRKVKNRPTTRPCWPEDTKSEQNTLYRHFIEPSHWTCECKRTQNLEEHMWNWQGIPMELRCQLNTDHTGKQRRIYTYLKDY